MKNCVVFFIFLVTYSYTQVCSLPVKSPTECSSLPSNRMSMPFLDLGYKQFYLGLFFKASWYRAAQFCRFHGMDLASVSNQDEQDKLSKHIVQYGLGKEHIWISASDLDKEGAFFWMSNGVPLTYTYWLSGEPNGGEKEDCVELWDKDGTGLKWNDKPCWFEAYFACELQMY